MRRSLINGKKGGDKVISLYWFVILTLIAGGVVMMTNAFYGKPYDVRGMESEILATKAADCIYFGGQMSSELVSDLGVLKGDFKDNFLEKCSLTFERDAEFKEEQYYLKMEFFDAQNLRKSVFVLEDGNQNYLADCKIKERSKNLPVCFEDGFWMNGPSNKVYFVEVTSIVSKTEQNVK